jgi:hypothetical protein
VVRVGGRNGDGNGNGGNPGIGIDIHITFTISPTHTDSPHILIEYIASIEFEVDFEKGTLWIKKYRNEDHEGSTSFPRNCSSSSFRTPYIITPEQIFPNLHQ